MKFANAKMSDLAVQQEKLGSFAKRSKRNDWAEQYEDMVRDLAPYPISYDVSMTQGLNFSEYTYTEFSGGLWVSTQCLEINCRLFHNIEKDFPYIDYDVEKDVLTKFQDLIADKYTLSSSVNKYKHVIFLPGHNLLDVADIDAVMRLIHQNDSIMIKPHPVTNNETIRIIGKRVGWNKVIGREVSGVELLRNCDVVYTSSASEMAITGAALGKKIVNISNFKYEGAGVYHPISRLLFNAQDNHGTAYTQSLVVKLINCKHSGIIMPWMTDIEDRIKAFYAKSLELREMYRPLASPTGNIAANSKPANNDSK